MLAQASWQLAYSPTSPPPLANPWGPFVFDEARGVGLLIAGTAGNNIWRWNGTVWDQPSVAIPAPRTDACFVYDSTRQVVIMCGGFSVQSGAWLPEVWEWNGTSWTLHTPAVFPSARAFTGFAFDRRRGVAVMFGGVRTAGGGVITNETWEWNGTTWSQATPAVRPSARQYPKLAYEPNTQSILMYGGEAILSGAMNQMFDTWTWDGSAWLQRTPAVPPPSRFCQFAAIGSDLDRSRVVLYGGSTYDSLTWEWDGTQWHGTPLPSPVIALGSSVSSYVMTYDTQRREVLMCGGLSPFSYLWRYRTNAAATTTSFGVGCAGSAGTPVLANAPYTLPWLGDTMRTRVNTVPASLGALFVSSLTPTSPISLDAVGMPGCNLLVGADVLEFRAASSGIAEWTLAIPNTPTLVGLSFQQQALPLDPAANALGLAASNALTLQLGVR